MSHSMGLRIVSVFGLIALFICFTTYRILKNRLKLSPRANRGLLVFMASFAILLVVGPMIYRMGALPVDSIGSKALQFTQYTFLGWLGITFLVFLTLEVLQHLYTLLSKPFDPGKRIFLTEGVARGIVGATTLATLGGFVETKVGPKVVPVEIKLKTLPESFNGFTIAQISDVHIGALLQKEFLDGVVDQILELKADAIFITGDLVDGSVEQLTPYIEPLKRLHAPHGIYFCTGNHEYYSGAQAWIEHLETMGIHVFKNTNKLLTKKNSTTQADEHLLLAGVYDFQASKYSDEHHTDPIAAAKTDAPVDCKILLAHNPYSIDQAAQAGFDLQMSGHTHAGQFYPFVWVAKLYLKHFEGHYQINEKTQLYVNRGTGYWGPPNRLGKMGEITHYTLRRST